MARSNWCVLEREARTALMVEAGTVCRGEERAEWIRREVAAEKSPTARWLRIRDSVWEGAKLRGGAEAEERVDR